MNKPQISNIRIYPVKSLDPIELEEVEIGFFSLKDDRTFAMVANDGRFVNGKRTGRVNQLKAEFNLAEKLIYLTPRNGGETSTFELKEGNAELDKFLTKFFELELSVLHRTQGELMDIPKESSVTIVSESSLKSLHDDLKDKTLEDLRLRFRTNLEIGGVEPFWEENLFTNPELGVHFSVGEVEMIGISPRARCNVPPRNPLTGLTDKSFVKRMMASRKESLPKNSKLEMFGNFYQLTVNTYLPENQKGKKIKIGDPVKIIDEVKFN